MKNGRNKLRLWNKYPQKRILNDPFCGKFAFIPRFNEGTLAPSTAVAPPMAVPLVRVRSEQLFEISGIAMPVARLQGVRSRGCFDKLNMTYWKPLLRYKINKNVNANTRQYQQLNKFDNCAYEHTNRLAGHVGSKEWQNIVKIRNKI